MAAVYLLDRFRGNAPPPEETGYADGVVRAGVIAAIFWGIAGFLVGDFIAWQLAYPVLNLDLPWTSFGRLRPLHTSAVIFAFGGNVLIASSFYVVQRTSRARLAGRWSPRFVFWGYQLFILIAATGYLLGVTSRRNTPSQKPLLRRMRRFRRLAPPTLVNAPQISCFKGMRLHRSLKCSRRRSARAPSRYRISALPFATTSSRCSLPWRVM
jgi:Cytochrome C and Quinol oxidase polypeptide I